MPIHPFRRDAENDHILPHHAGAYIHTGVEFSPAEHDHVLHCEDCLRLFILCLTSDSFGAVLKKLDSDQRRSA
jgi:hypothetical protein